ncbi:HAD family hydrolase [Lysobacter sp. TY2-98]|uniref:HAD family hydrolase n=1 Tax=Lysobacter sp. TY2-98 TaxID=2290922 RepID=UPI000E1FD911|nr:HAD family hydrolase [Lysobacter sp. TY2-98]AXK71594.1 HAD family hydrolase [Lysobacter sp. TY2-98]
MDLALFDFDGTITTVETYPPFIAAATARWRIALGYPPLAPLILAYRRGLITGNPVRAAIARVAFTGADAASIEAIGETFAKTGLPPLVRPEAMARIHAHRRRGDTVVIVSGNFDVLLEPWARAHDLPVLCSRLERRDGRMTGRYDGAQCVRGEKVRRIREAFDLSQFERIHAYGDTAEDTGMLGIAHHPYYQRIPNADEGLLAT